MNNINIIYEDESGISLIKVILVFSLLNIATSSSTLSHQLKDFINDDRIIQHIVGFITVMVIITLLKSNYKMKISNSQIILYSVFAYLWYLFSTKMDLHLNLIFLLLLVLGYFYENMLREKSNELNEDKILTENEKNEIILKNKNKEKYMFWGLVVATMVGVYLYSNKKQVQYGGGYNILNFLFY